MKRTTKLKQTLYHYFILVISAFCLFFYHVLTVNATEEQKPLTGFSYEVILPDNQHNKKVSYYDLRMKPEQKQTIQMKLNNSSEQPVTILVGLYGARTNSNGVIQYNKNEIPKDPSLKVDFEKIAKAPKEVIIEPNSNQILDIELQMPKEKFLGYVAGAVNLEEKEQKNQNTKTNQGMIKNRFVYQVGIQLSEEDSEQMQPELKLNKVYPELSNFRNAIFVNFSNIEPVYVNDMTLSAVITKKGSKEPLYEAKKSQMRMAPNTMIDFPISLNGEEMNPGDYRASILVTTQAGGRWEWQETFTITDEQAKKYNDQDLTLDQSSGINWKLIAMIICLFIVVAVFIFVLLTVLKKRRKKSSYSRKNKK